MISFKSHITNTLLGFFFMNPKQSLYINELSEKLDLDLGNLFRKLKELEADGILISETRGRQKYFHLNEKFPLLEEYKNTFEFAHGPIIKLTASLKNINNIEQAFIFGSYANNNFNPASDIDLLVIGSHSILDLKKKILPLEKTLGREINIVNYSAQYFSKLKNSDDFIKNIFSKKTIKLI